MFLKFMTTHIMEQQYHLNTKYSIEQLHIHNYLDINKQLFLLLNFGFNNKIFYNKIIFL